MFRIKIFVEYLLPMMKLKLSNKETRIMENLYLIL